MTQNYHHPVDVLSYACEALDAAHDIALIIVTNVSGGAMRATGAMMCVRGDGHGVGYVSNGCVDADIIFQAVEATKDGQVRRLVYGEGSPFRDIQLPCGGRIDLVVIPKPHENYVRVWYEHLRSRRSVKFTCSRDGEIEIVGTSPLSGFTHIYRPKLKIRIVGRGDAVTALARQSVQSGFDVHVASPDEDIGEGLTGVRFDHLINPSKVPDVIDDPWSAVVVMFHDHAWEPAILKQALAGPAFYIGAMGSPRTHENRLKILEDMDFSKAEISRVRGPIGLIPSMRDANLLALSTLAEIVSVAQESGCL